MKTLLPVLSILTLAHSYSFAQCDKPAKLTTLSTTHKDKKGAVIKVVDETLVFSINKKDITLTDLNGTIKATCRIDATDCNWPVPFKVGKSFFKGVLMNDGGDTMDITLTVEGKQGLISAAFTVAGGESDVLVFEVDRLIEGN